MFQRLARLIARIFFSELMVIGKEKIPTHGPLVVVANHINGLVDPLLVYGILPRPPCTLGKSTLWDMWYLAWLLDAAGVLPVYRKHDPGVDRSKNKDTFAACHQALANGAIVALFPEGISHDEPELQPLRTGAARIALQAEAAHGPLGVRFVPIGITFDDKYTFRSRALLVVGDPIELEAAELSTSGVLDDSRETVLALTARIEDAIRDVTLNYESWEQARLFRQAAEYIQGEPEIIERLGALVKHVRGGSGGAEMQTQALEGVGLHGTWQLERALDLVLPYLRESCPEETEAAIEEVRNYGELLHSRGLKAQWLPPYPALPRVLRWMVGRLADLFFFVPLSCLGVLLNYVPYRLVGVLANASGNRHLAATYKTYSSIVVFPVFWCGYALLIASWQSWEWGLLALIVAPLLGYRALRFKEAGDDLLRALRGFFTRRSVKRDLATGYQRLREALLRVERLAMERR